MSNLTTLPAVPRPPRVTFRNVLRSEWIKFTSVRSSYWTAGLTVGITALFAGVIILGLLAAPEDPSISLREVLTATFGAAPSLGILSFAYAVAHALVAVLAVLIVSTERSSGLLSVTVAAVPRRTPVLAAKLLLSGVAGFALGLVSGLASFLIVQPSLGELGFGLSITDPSTVQVLMGGALYLALIAVLSTAIASMFRSTAAAAGTVLGLILIAPGVVPMIPFGIGNAIGQVLPTAAGMMLYQPADQVGWSTVGAGLMILLAWVVAATLAAGLLLKRRDV